MRNWLEHVFNPLHIMCRLVGWGFELATARVVAYRYQRWYDRICYWEEVR